MSDRTLPARRGPRPPTTATNPHRQLEQNAPTALQEELWQRMSALPLVEVGASRISVPGARALFLPEGAANGPPDAFLIDHEFAHLHPASDGSLHLTLPKALGEEAVEQGWAEPHPLVGRGIIPDKVVMVYGPRDAGELDIVWSLIEASYRYARGEPEER